MPVSSVLAGLPAFVAAAGLSVVVSSQAIAGCTAERDTFKAWNDTTPGTAHDLIVTGKVQCTSTGWQVKLTTTDLQGRPPHDLLLKLDAVPPVGMAGQMITEHDVRFQQAHDAGFQNVTIEGGGPEFTVAVREAQ
ncbi:MAG TPA: hypothetical protein VMF67_05340 [Rhizomicrobium sp.]|nr:hypothetical protein [Rhizomicrobium sp.]